MKRLLIGSELQQLKITGYMVELSCANLGQQSTHEESLQIKLEISLNSLAG